jgi:hypothetical protein
MFLVCPIGSRSLVSELPYSRTQVSCRCLSTEADGTEEEINNYIDSGDHLDMGHCYLNPTCDLHN